MYKTKYLKYKIKYINLKNQFGGEIEHDDSILIPEMEVPYEDKTLYHINPMYKKLVRYYLPLMTKILAIDNDNMSGNPEMPKYINGSFIKNDKMDETYKICNNKNVTFSYPFEENHLFEVLNSCKSYYYGNTSDTSYATNTYFHILKKNKSLFVFFNIGQIMHNYSLDNNRYNYFIDFLEQNKKNFEDAKQIILCGHSAGMTQAILTAFIFLCISNKEYRERNKIFLDVKEHFSIKIKELIDSNIYFDLFNNKSLFVVGTGSCPTFLVDNYFKDFYNTLKGKFVHIISGINLNNIGETNKYYLDFFSKPIDDNLKNYKFGVYINNFDIEKFEYLEKNPYDINFYSFDKKVKFYGEYCPFCEIVLLNKDNVKEFDNKYMICKNEEIYLDFKNFMKKTFNKDINNSKKCYIIPHIIHNFSNYRASLSIFFFGNYTD